MNLAEAVPYPELTTDRSAKQEMLLSVRGLSKSFGADIPVFRDISFEVPASEITCIVGSNGSGKSTLLRCCMQLIPADSGSVRLFGNDLGSQSPKSLRTLRARVGFIFQKHNLVPRLSVLSNVLHGALALKSTPRLWYHGFASSADRNEAMHCLSRVGLADLAARRVETLSGGQSQRVAIARALMQRPTVLFADEPVASLDPQAGQEVMELFVRLVREEGLSLVFVSHHLEHALHYSDRILGLKDSYLQLDTTPSRESLDSLRAIYGKVDLSTGVQV